ncbi:hypothetical protein [Vibrio kanaloae]|jgi:hypothetical protein|uniref:hypothetical protein n=1 Tax=Vibrio kanaloae TaxID=170673 RepID=UPI0011B4254E|nr:hypothetical protein [Vibrio kanaloae]
MFEKIMKIYAVNATVSIHDKPANKISIDTNACTATDRIQQSYDFRRESGRYNLDNGLIFTNGHHYIAYETYQGPEPDSILILTSRCSDRKLDEEKSKIWVDKGIQEARKQADKILKK